MPMVIDSCCRYEAAAEPEAEDWLPQIVLLSWAASSLSCVGRAIHSER